MTTSDDEFHGPPVTGEYVRERQAKLLAAAQAADRADTADFLARIKAKADAEIARWSALPCEGLLANVSACSDVFAMSCPEYEHSMCPRRQASRETALAARLREDRRRDLERAGVSPRTLKAVFDVPPMQTDALVSLRSAFAANQRPTIVVLQGGVGCGKSCAAAVWATDTGAHWVTAKAIARMGYDDDIAELGRHSALVIDDLGTEYADAKGFFLSNLDGLIDDRYARELPTVITTNVAPAEFKARYGDRIADRIREAGKFISVKGDSMRRKS